MYQDCGHLDSCVGETLEATHKRNADKSCNLISYTGHQANLCSSKETCAVLGLCVVIVCSNDENMGYVKHISLMPLALLERHSDPHSWRLAALLALVQTFGQILR